MTRSEPTAADLIVAYLMARARAQEAIERAPQPGTEYALVEMLDAADDALMAALRAAQLTAFRVRELADKVATPPAP